VRILDAYTNQGEAPQVSACFRKPTPGHEYEMLMHFVHNALPSPCGDERLAVFIEPRLETGCPDAVALYWRAAEAVDPDALRRLGSADDRLLQLIWLEGGIPFSRFKDRWGAQASRRVRELVSLGLVRSDDSILSVPEEGLVVSRLIAVEAKMAGPSGALGQAARNMWFASESYALMPALPTARDLCERYKSCGVGIVTPQQNIDEASIPARAVGLPQSHVTWRFNRMALELCAFGAA